MPVFQLGKLAVWLGLVLELYLWIGDSRLTWQCRTTFGIRRLLEERTTLSTPDIYQFPNLKLFHGLAVSTDGKCEYCSLNIIESCTRSSTVIEGILLREGTKIYMFFEFPLYFISRERIRLLYSSLLNSLWLLMVPRGGCWQTVNFKTFGHSNYNGGAFSELWLLAFDKIKLCYFEWYDLVLFRVNILPNFYPEPWTQYAPTVAMA